MNATSLLSAIPSFDTHFSRFHDGILLALTLTAGLIVVAPALHVFSGIRLLLWVAVVGGLYISLVILIRRFVLGCFIALVVTMTFAANVPLASGEYLRGMPGMLGPNIWLVNLPMAILIPIVGYYSIKSHIPSILPEYTFTGFVVWSAVIAVIGTPIRTDTALYFSLFALQGLIVFILVNRGVRNGNISIRLVIGSLTISVVGHALFGLVQFINQAPFGFSYLGEPIERFMDLSYAVISLGPVQRNLGLFVTGFTGMSFILASLIILVAPILLAVALQSNRRIRVLSLIAFVVLAVVLRLTITDAGRGGLMLAILVFMILLAMWSWPATRERLRSKGYTPLRPDGSGQRGLTKYTGLIFAILISTVAVAYPSSKSGATSRDPTSQSRNNPGQAEEGTASQGGATGAEGAQPSVPTGDVSIPLVDLSNLKVRLRQYVIAIDIFPENPILGIGGGNFQYVAAKYIGGSPKALHNIYLALLIETGIPGFVLYMSTVAIVLWSGWRLVAMNHERLIHIGIVAGIVGYLGFAFWDHLAIDRITSFLPFWALGAAVIGERYRIEGDSSRSNVVDT